MFLSILEMVLPVVTMFLLGYLMNRKKLLTEAGHQGLKSVVSNITLPVVLFNAFFTAEYNGRILLTFGVVYVSCGLGLALGFLLRRFVRPYDKFMPFLVTNFEGGMLGYALFGLLYPGRTGVFAMADIGQTLAAYSIFLVTLTTVSSGRSDPKGIAKSALTNQALIGAFLGVLLGALGLGKTILSSPVGGVISSLISFISAPTSALILLIVGYELSFRRELMGPVLKTVGLRLVITALLCVLGSLIIFSVLPFEKELLVALLLAWSLPAPFIIPLYADVTGHGNYISATLSMQTLLSIFLFIAVSVYTLA